jgi:hypothetical protein
VQGLEIGWKGSHVPLVKNGAMIEEEDP